MKSEVVLPRDGDHQKAASVVGVSRNNEGQIIREFNHNPILNTKVCDVMFPDGAVHQYEAKLWQRTYILKWINTAININ